MATEVIVVTVRHPDFANETSVFGADSVRTIDLDLGRGFDITHSSPREYDTLLSWAASHYREISDLAADHEARLMVEEQIREALRSTGRYEISRNDDLTWTVFDWAEQTVVANGLDYDAAREQQEALEAARDLLGEVRLEAARDAV